MENRMRKSILLLAIIGMLVAALAIPALARTTGRGTGPIVNVISQGLTYDSIVTADPLPFNGTDNWQQLIPTGVPGVLDTQYGPGDQEYFGGRWFVDMDGDNLPSDGDHFFLCPLLGPGTPTPSA
jgi:hypothetical protein